MVSLGVQVEKPDFDDSGGGEIFRVLSTSPRDLILFDPKEFVLSESIWARQSLDVCDPELVRRAREVCYTR